MGLFPSRAGASHVVSTVINLMPTALEEKECPSPAGPGQAQDKQPEGPGRSLTGLGGRGAADA